MCNREPPASSCNSFRNRPRFHGSCLALPLPRWRQICSATAPNVGGGMHRYVLSRARPESTNIIANAALDSIRPFGRPAVGERTPWRRRDRLATAAIFVILSWSTEAGVRSYNSMELRSSPSLPSSVPLTGETLKYLPERGALLTRGRVKSSSVNANDEVKRTGWIIESTITESGAESQEASRLPHARNDISSDGDEGVAK